MAFGIPLALKEKWHIVNQDVICEMDGMQTISHGVLAQHLNNLFKGYNKGTRQRMTVYLFRQSDEYKEMKIKREIKAKLEKKKKPE